MYARILIPLKDPKVDETALRHIEELVSKLVPEVKVEVILLQVISLPHYVMAGRSVIRVSYTEKVIEEIKKKAKEYLDKAGVNLRSKGATVKTKVVTGRVAEEIIKVADEIKAGLIAMSTHGHSSVSRLTFGSITDKVLRTGTVPLLVVRKPKDTMRQHFSD